MTERFLICSILKYIHDLTVHRGRQCVKNYRSAHCTEADIEWLTTVFLHFVMFKAHPGIVRVCVVRCDTCSNAVGPTKRIPDEL
jgi:hypothetical protein